MQTPVDLATVLGELAMAIVFAGGKSNRGA